MCVRRDNEPHGLDRLDEKAPDIGAALAEFRDAPFEPPPVPHESEEAEGHRDHADREQPRVEPHQRRHGAGEEEHVADPGQRGLGGHLLDLADIVVDARHDVAEPGPGVEPRRQPLQVPEHGQAHVEEDVG